MISIVAEVINLFACIVHKVFLIASFAGKIIVTTIAGISNAVFRIFENFLLFLHILYEDNIVLFSEDIPNFINDATSTIESQISNIINGLVGIYYDCTNHLAAAIDAPKILAASIFVVVGEVMFLLKDATIYLGSALWLIISFIPVHLPQLMNLGIMCVKNVVFSFVVDTYMLLLKCTNFMTDVPLESFIGITSAILIVRLCVHFRAAILSGIVDMYWFLIRKLLYLYYTMYNYVTDSEVRVIAHMASGQNIAPRDANYSAGEVDDNAADALCIVCQERQKCVLTLPCRHVCLCAECCRRLYGYQRTCPICRTFIYHSVTVYL